jgi:subtilisin
MAEQKNGSSGRTGAKRAAQTADEPSQPEAKTSEHNRATSSALARRKKQYLIGVRTFRGFAAPAADSILQALEQMEDVDILRRLRRKGFQSFGTSSLVGDLEIIVAQMDEKRAQSLRQSAPPHVVIEHDARLGVGQARLSLPLAFPFTGRPLPAPRQRYDVRFRILGEGDRPLSGAGITVVGQGYAAQAITDTSGSANLTFFDAEGDIDTIRAILVQPAADHWGSVIQEPVLDQADPNVIKLNPLPVSLTKPSPEKAIPSWGQKAMNLDRLLGAGLTGARVKIALIDSGCDNTHPLLRHITRGVDLTRRDGAKDWTHDDIGQGTHCAGIVCGSGGSTSGLNGIAPSAEIHVFKLSPGGHLSDLIDALDQCIERQIDIVHLGVVSDQVSELVTHKVIEARLKGVACIAAAGDTGGPVQFPGVIPGVLCVSALGRLGDYPQDTPHALTATPELIGPTGFFAMNMSASGPSIGVCAPGVAVISCVPGGGLAARDGTATAAAHVVGFAALILAHHPLFRSAHETRSEERVSALFELVRNSAVSHVFDPMRVGAGMPDFQHVPGIGTPDADAWNKAAQNFATMAGGRERFGERLPSGMPQGDFGTMTWMHLRASGLI